jgi:hypothetical protein
MSLYFFAVSPGLPHGTMHQMQRHIPYPASPMQPTPACLFRVGDLDVGNKEERLGGLDEALRHEGDVTLVPSHTALLLEAADNRGQHGVTA